MGLRGVSRRTAIIIAVTAGLIVFAAGAAFTAAFTLTSDRLVAGATDASACDTSGITAGIANPMSWSIGSAPGTTVVQYTLTNVDATCNGKQWQAAIGASANANQCIAKGSGTLSVSANTATIALGSDGCLIPDFSVFTNVGSLTVSFYE